MSGPHRFARPSDQLVAGSLHRVSCPYSSRSTAILLSISFIDPYMSMLSARTRVEPRTLARMTRVEAFVDLAPFDDLHGGQDQAFAVAVVAAREVAAGVGSAAVVLVRAAEVVEDQLALVEDGAEERPVGEVAELHDEGVVGDDEIVGPDVVAADVVQHALERDVAAAGVHRHEVADAERPLVPVEQHRAHVADVGRGHGETLAEEPCAQLLVHGVQPGLDDCQGQ